MSRRIRQHVFTNPDNNEVWPVLSENDPVTLVNKGGWRLEGRVETQSHDRACLWIQLNSGMGRQLIHHQDGFVLDK